MSTHSFSYSDLACERHRAAPSERGVRYREAKWRELLFTALTVEKENDLGKPPGRYLSVCFSPTALWTADSVRALTEALATAILFFLSPSPKCVLVAGLGNRRMTADALGPLVCDGVLATAALPKAAAALGLSPPVRTAVFVPDVFARTGIESTKSIACAGELCAADAVLAIDALAAHDSARLLRVLELTDTGTVPGGGVKQGTASLSQEVLGIPVISIGLPTVIRTDAAHFLIPHDLEEGVAEIASLTAQAINNAFGPDPPRIPFSFEKLFSKEEV